MSKVMPFLPFVRVGDKSLNLQREPGVPWEIIESHEKQAQKNHYQSLDRLRERHGLAPSEMLAILEDRPWWSMSEPEALERCRIIIANHGVKA
jgi:hypothetical protein